MPLSHSTKKLYWYCDIILRVLWTTYAISAHTSRCSNFLQRSLPGGSGFQYAIQSRLSIMWIA